MAKELIVDTSRLEVAAGVLRSLALPSAPSPVTVAGGDAVSAAINAAMPVVESPVIRGLPAVQATLAATAENMAAAAKMYVETDRAHGEALGQWDERPERWEEQSSGGAVAGRSVSRAPSATGQPTSRAEAADRLSVETTPDWAATVGELSEMAAGGQTVMTSVQSAVGSIQGAVSSMQGAAGSTPTAQASAAAPTEDAQAAGSDQTDRDETLEEPAEEGAAAHDGGRSRAPLTPAATPDEAASPMSTGSSTEAPTYRGAGDS